jgi:hypothetical protein
MAGEERITDASRAAHTVAVSVLEERCVLCGELAAHAVVETGCYLLQPLGSYLCCVHFTWIFNDCSEYAYQLPTQRRA